MTSNIPMIVLEIESDIAGYRYKVWFYKDKPKWRIDHIQFIRGVEPFLPKRIINETFDNEFSLIDYATKYCELVVKHLATTEFQNPEPVQATQMAASIAKRLEAEPTAQG